MCFRMALSKIGCVKRIDVGGVTIRLGRFGLQYKEFFIPGSWEYWDKYIMWSSSQVNPELVSGVKDDDYRRPWIKETRLLKAMLEADTSKIKE